MASKIKLRRGTAAQWTSNNPTLDQGEIGYETDTGKFKIGTGSTGWSSITYFAPGGSGTVTSVSGAGTVNGLTLTGTVTTSGNLTLGGTLDLSSPPAIGGTAAAAGSFTTLSASSTVSGTGFSTYLASPPAIGGTAPAAGSFTTLSASSTVSGTGFSTYLASPPAIGGTAAAAGSFTTLSASSTVSGTGFSDYLASPPAIGGTAAAAGSFTTLSASSTVSGTGFSTYLASPPAIGGTAAAAGTFTTLVGSSVGATQGTTGSSNLGAFYYGTLGYSDQNTLASFQSSVNNYNQLVVQNTNSGSAASADLTISNNLGTASTFYGNFGMNSSGWAGTLGTSSLNAPSVVYVTATSSDLVLGTTTAHNVRIVTNSGADAVIIDTAGDVGLGVTSPTAKLHLKAGTATANTAPLKFTSGTNLTTAEAGTVEYDGSLQYFTPTGTSRALTPNAYYYRKNTSTTLASNTSNQSIFGLTSGVTVAANTIYEVECEFELTTTGTSSHTEAFGFTLATATVTNMGVTINRLSATTTSSALGGYLTSVTPVVVTGALTTAQTVAYRVKGVIAFGTAGSINPVIAFSAGPGGTSTIVLGSWMKMTPIGTTGSNVSIGTWA